MVESRKSFDFFRALRILGNPNLRIYFGKLFKYKLNLGENKFERCLNQGRVNQCMYNGHGHLYDDSSAPSLHGKNREIGAKEVNIKVSMPFIFQYS